MQTQSYIAIIALSSLLSCILSAIMLRLSVKLGYIDHPTERKIHLRPTPLGGGVAIFVAFALILGISIILANIFSYDVHQYVSSLKDKMLLRELWQYKTGIVFKEDKAIGILICAFILFTLGLIDDIKDLRPIPKLIVQFITAIIAVIVFDIKLHLFIESAWISATISILWIVIITNAINFMDNTDGLATGVSIISTAVLAIVAISNGQILVGSYLAALFGVMLGFLPFNFPPAKMFLGDAGSLTIGFLLSIGAILTTYYNELNPKSQPTAVFIPIIALAIPLYDFCSVIIIRILNKKSPFIADHRHFSHRLLKRGLSVREAVITIYIASVALATGAILLRYLTGIATLLVIIQTVCIIAIIAILESTKEEKAGPESRGAEILEKKNH